MNTSMNDYYSYGPFDDGEFECDNCSAIVDEDSSLCDECLDLQSSTEDDVCPDCNKMERDCRCPWEESK